MKRREFLNVAAMGAAGIATAGVTAQIQVASGQEDHAAESWQSDDGIRIHEFESDLMKGFPPPPDQRVTRTSHVTSRQHRVWAHQHMSELCTTQQISRGTGAVRVLPRKHRDLDSVLVTGSQGSNVKLIELLRESFTDAFLVMRDGVILNEQYFSGMRPDTRHHLWSASKSISVGVVFSLLYEGALKETSLVTDVIPELADSGYRGATIRHLMDMQSGVEYDYIDNLPMDTTSKEVGRHLRVAGFFPKLPDEDPDEGQYDFFEKLKSSSERAHGSIFYYKCCDTGVLGWVCEKVTGRRFVDLVRDYVWSKIGAERDAYIISDVQGSCSPNVGMSVTLRDLGRWGQVHADGGSWNGQQIIPTSYLDDIQRNYDPSKFTPQSFPPSPASSSETAYRNQFWISAVHPICYCAAGHYGQYCHIHPETNTVIVRFATEDPGPNQPNWTQIINNALSELVKAL